MALTSDWHIHTHNSCDGACITLVHLMRRAAAKGITDYGITDHLHSAYNLPDIAASRREFLSVQPPPNVHFGIELSCMSAWELAELATGKYERPVYGLRQGGPPGAPTALAWDAALMKEHGVEYVVAGTHWPLYVPFEREAIIRDYHRQNMFLATHPLVDIVAHPWWWMGHWQDPDGCYRREPWFDDFRHIPTSMHDEFAAACRERGKKIEANISANLLNEGYPEAFRRQYAEYLASLKAQGATLSLGGDCHDGDYQVDFEAAEAMLAKVGLTDRDFWRLPPRK